MKFIKKIKDDYNNSNEYKFDEKKVYNNILRELNLSKKENKSINYKMKLCFSSVILFLICIFSLTFFYKNNDSLPNIYFNYIKLQINPEIEIITDENNIVLGIKGLNDDGRKILYSKNYENLDLVNVINLLCDEFDKNGYFLKSDLNIYVGSKNLNTINKLKNELEYNIYNLDVDSINNDSWNDLLKEHVDYMVETKNLITEDLETYYNEAKSVYMNIYARKSVVINNIVYNILYEILNSLLNELEDLRSDYCLNEIKYEKYFKSLKDEIEELSKSDNLVDKITLEIKKELLEEKLRLYNEFQEYFKEKYNSWKLNLEECLNDLKALEEEFNINLNFINDYAEFKLDFLNKYQEYINEILN